jgi:hypothetical protein
MQPMGFLAVMAKRFLPRRRQLAAGKHKVGSSSL